MSGDKIKQHFQNKMFMGMEFDPTMIRIGGMNLMLHALSLLMLML